MCAPSRPLLKPNSGPRIARFLLPRPILACQACQLMLNKACHAILATEESMQLYLVGQWLLRACVCTHKTCMRTLCMHSTCMRTLFMGTLCMHTLCMGTLCMGTLGITLSPDKFKAGCACCACCVAVRAV